MTRAGRFAGTGLEVRYADPSDPRNTAFTPAYVLEEVRRALGGAIDLDPCTTPDNPTGARVFYALPQDGLNLPWVSVGTVYCNPPYGKARQPWVDRCIQAGLAGARVVLLIPAATETKPFQKALRFASSVLFVKGRIRFGTLRPNRRETAASHPSALLGFGGVSFAGSKLGHAFEQIARERTA